LSVYLLVIQRILIGELVRALRTGEASSCNYYQQYCTLLPSKSPAFPRGGNAFIIQISEGFFTNAYAQTTLLNYPVNGSFNTR